MKRTLSLALAVLLAFSLLALAGCGGGSNSIKTGLGIVTSIASSKAATADAAGNAQVDSYIAVVTLDSGGKITNCALDAAQTKISFDINGKVTADLTAPIQTKVEKGPAYGMASKSGIGKEWYEQAAAFAKWCVGKTPAQVAGMKLQADPASPGANITAEPDLTASCTISVDNFLAAIAKAVANVQSGTASGAVKSGMGVVTSIASSKDADPAAPKDGVGQVDSYIAAVALDSSGKIVVCTLDSAQTKVTFDATGALTADLNAPIQSKDEKGAAYGMKSQSKIGKEWNEQAAAFAAWCVGKTPAQVAGMKLQVDPASASANITAEPDLTASVTISVDGFLAAIAKAAANAA
ncbi:MAG: hypothetical protein FWC62_06020 [Firmicutes bacterium]|nr:hypothetical protein [Bacillota bacterium]